MPPNSFTQAAARIARCCVLKPGAVPCNVNKAFTFVTAIEEAHTPAFAKRTVRWKWCRSERTSAYIRMFRSGASQLRWSTKPSSDSASLPVSFQHTSEGLTDDTVPNQPPIEQQQQYQHSGPWHSSAGLDFEQAAKQWLRQQHLTNVWLPHTSSASGPRPSPGDLVGAAAQACQELSVSSLSQAHARASTFTDRLRSNKVQSLCTFHWQHGSQLVVSAPEHPPLSMQGSFLCAEAHPDLGGSLVVLAISESLLPWEDYCKALPSSAVPDDEHAADTSNCCAHPAVHAAAMKVLLTCKHKKVSFSRDFL